MDVHNLASRIYYKQFGNKQILIVDYNDLDGEGIRQMFTLSKNTICQSEKRSLLLLEYVDHVTLGESTMEDVESYLNEIQPYLKRYATVGAIPQIIKKLYLNQFELQTFEKKDEAINYLTK